MPHLCEASLQRPTANQLSAASTFCPHALASSWQATHPAHFWASSIMAKARDQDVFSLPCHGTFRSHRS